MCCIGVLEGRLWGFGAVCGGRVGHWVGWLCRRARGFSWRVSVCRRMWGP